MPYITQLERLHREISQPLPPQEKKPAPVNTESKKIELTRADVNSIIERTRIASAEELQQVISHDREYALTTGERNQLGCDLSIVMAQRARQMNGRREDPNARFIAQTLGLLPTPFGLVAREFVEGQLRAGAQAIQRCKNHRPPKCQCWAASRVALWQAQASGEKTPEGWAATRIYSTLEELELASRPESPSGHNESNP